MSDSPQQVKQREEVKSTEVPSVGGSVRRRPGLRGQRNEFIPDTATSDVHVAVSRSEGSGSLP